VLERAAELGLPSVVILFEPLPREYLAPEGAPARLMSFREKFEAMAALGVDRVLRVRFNEALRTMSALEFIERIFVDGLGAKCVILGDDLRFGHDREGGFELMREQGEVHGFECVHTDTLDLDGERVSSTRIRQALAAADFALAERLLGRPYAIAGKVVYGAQRGRELGVPTANLKLHRLEAPLSGVYAVEVTGAATGAADRTWPGVANVGFRPTVGDQPRASLEVHLLDFDGHLYGKRLVVTFREKIREEVKFESLDALQEQIEKDIAHGREYFDL
jgi:riboflavin kinase/FMN adenylyltransferase